MHKILVVGDIGVGKTSFIQRFADENFRWSAEQAKKQRNTSSVEWYTKDVEVFLPQKKHFPNSSPKTAQVTLRIFDTAGEEQFRQITLSMYRGSAAVCILYDITVLTSFVELTRWIDDVRKYCFSDCVIVVCGNKRDQNKRRMISEDAAIRFCTEKHVQYFETSVQNNVGVTETFDYIAKRLHLLSKTKAHKENAKNFGKWSPLYKNTKCVIM